MEPVLAVASVRVGAGSERGGPGAEMKMCDDADSGHGDGRSGPGIGNAGVKREREKDREGKFRGKPRTSGGGADAAEGGGFSG